MDKAVTMDREDQLVKARILQNQIADKEKLPAKLEKQPYLFNYLAAFIGRCSLNSSDASG